MKLQITLNQDEIIEAVVAYVHGQISVAPNQKIEVDLKAGRGENGFTATLDIRSTGTALPAAAVAKPEVVNMVMGSAVARTVDTVVTKAAEPVAAPKEDPKPAKTTKASSIFGKSPAAAAPAPLVTEEPVGALPEAVATEEATLPHQDPDNLATLPEDGMGSELDDTPLQEDPPAATQPEAGVKSSSIFKFAKG
jgi:hypothetical protein